MEARKFTFYLQILVGFLFVYSWISRGVFNISTLLLLLIGIILFIFEVYLNKYYDEKKLEQTKQTLISKENKDKEVEKKNLKINHSIHAEIKKFQVIPWEVPDWVWDSDKKDLKESVDDDELLNKKESLYLSLKSSEGWDLIKVEHIASERKKEVSDKKKYYWKRKFIK
jgi:cell division protein FtsL